MRRLFLRSLLTLGALAASVAQGADPLASAPAEYRDLPRETLLDGTVEAIQQTTVSAQIQGRVTDVLFDVDDYVKKGEIVVLLSDTEPLARLARTEAELEEAEARLEEAEDSHQRTRELYGRKLVSESDRDAAVAQLKAARARLDAARAGLRQVREQHEYTRVRAPYSGIVTERLVEVGEVVQPGQPLMSGINLERLRVKVDVPQSLVNRIREYGDARIMPPGGQSPDIPATKITVFPVADPYTNTFRVRLELPAGGAAELFPGMFVKTRFLVGSRRALVVPTPAIVQRSELTAVYVRSEQGTVSLRQIRAGAPVSQGMTSVLAGLDPGERVAVDPIAAGRELKRQRGKAGDE